MIEAFPDVLLVCFGEARTFVAHRYAGIVALDMQGNIDGSISFGVFEGVGVIVGYDLSDAVSIDKD